MKRILAALVLTASPAFAEYTPVERPHAIAAFEGARQFSWAEFWTGSAIAAARTPAGRAALATVVADQLRTERDWKLMVFGLSGWIGHGKTRAENLAAFRLHLARGLTDSLPGAVASLARARLVPGESPAYYEGLNIAEHLLRTEALPRFASIDPSLPYLDPAPQELLVSTTGVKQTVFAFIKPHGDYYRGARHAGDGANYAGDAVAEGWLPFYRRLRPTAAVKWDPVLGGLYRGRGFGLVQLYAAARDAYGLGLLDDPHTDEREGPPDRFCQVLFASKQLTNARDGSQGESLAETLVAFTSASGSLANAIAEESDAARRRDLAAALERFILRTADWWGNAVDGFSWSLFRFENQPQVERCTPTVRQ